MELSFFISIGQKNRKADERKKREDEVIGIYQGKKIDPLTILWDLVENAKGDCCEDNVKRVIDDFYNAWGTYGDESEFNDYFRIMCELRDGIICAWDNSRKVMGQANNRSPFSLSEFEIMRSYYRLTFEFYIAKVSDISGLNNWQPLRYGFLDNLGDVFDCLKEQCFYVYMCKSMLDVVFSILHYYLLNEYKFRLCEHCGKIFATKSFKTKYCTRKSPLNAARNWKDELSRGVAVDFENKRLKKEEKR